MSLARATRGLVAMPTSRIATPAEHFETHEADGH
jgi:hypothetical protein